jgi:hypothetical protein
MNTEMPKPGSTVTGPLFPEPVQVIVCVPIGVSVKLIARASIPARKEQIARKLPDDFDDLPDEEQQEILSALEDVVASVDPAALRGSIH